MNPRALFLLMRSPYSAVLRKTIVPVAERFGYIVLRSECYAAHFGNTTVTFEGPCAHAQVTRDRGFWALEFSIGPEKADHVVIDDWVEIIDGRSFAELGADVCEEDDVQLFRLARLWADYGLQIDALLSPSSFSSAWKKVEALRKKRVTKPTSHYEKKG